MSVLQGELGCFVTMNSERANKRFYHHMVGCEKGNRMRGCLTIDDIWPTKVQEASDLPETSQYYARLNIMKQIKWNMEILLQY